MGTRSAWFAVMMLAAGPGHAAQQTAVPSQLNFILEFATKSAFGPERFAGDRRMGTLNCVSGTGD